MPSYVCKAASVNDPTLPEHPWVQTLGPHLYLQTYPARFGDEELAVFLAFTEAFIHAAPTPYAWVVDIGGMMRSSGKQRKAITDLGKRTESWARQHSAGTAIVAKSAIARALVKTTYLVKKPPFEVAVVQTVDEGAEWARKQLSAQGIG